MRYLALLANEISGLKILVVTKDDHEHFGVTRHEVGLDASRLVVVSADFADMPRMVASIDVRRVLSQAGVRPEGVGAHEDGGVPLQRRPRRRQRRRGRFERDRPRRASWDRRAGH